MICSLCGEYVGEDDSCYCDKLKMKYEIFDKSPDNKIVHPSYYNWFEIECMDVVKNFDFLLGNVIKYCWRCGLKSSTTKLEDLKKAKYYIEIAIEMENKRCNSGT